LRIRWPIRLTAGRVIGLTIVVIGSVVVPIGSGNLPATAPAVAAADAPGRIFFVHGGDIWVLQGGKPFQVTTDRGWLQPNLSPDGSQLVAVGVYSNATEVIVLNPDGSNQIQLTRNTQRSLDANEWAFFPRWSPNGQSIAYVSDRTSFYPMLWVMRPDGTGPRQVTFVRNGADAIDSFAWSPDGSQIAATRFNVTDSQISIIDLGPPATSRQVTAEAGGAYDPAWSPDGHYLAYMARSGTRSVISVLDLQSGSTTPLFETDTARAPQWSPNGTTLAYLALTGKNFEIFSLDLRWDANGAIQPGRTGQLTSDFGADGISGLSWVP